MRLIPRSTVEAWHTGNMIGDRRNMARVTIQQGGTKLFQLPYNLYASTIFGADSAPKELPNVKAVKWQRGATQDFATATIEFFNTAPLPLGTQPTRDLDMPGYYTFTRGMTSFSSRWGQSPNAWSRLLVPDNILRTYEGYGFDPTQIPEADPFLVSTGVWRIDDVLYDATGLITVTCRDIGSILADEILFPPVVPENFYPVTFTADLKDDVGFVGPSVATHTQDTADISQPASWHGPVAGPATLTTSVGSDEVTVNWTRPGVADTPGDNTHKGYKVVGYQLAVDGVLMSQVYAPTVLSATLAAKHGIRNGNVYSIRAVAIWREVLNRAAELHFKTNVEATVRSNFSTERIVRPRSSGTVPTVTPGSIALNVNPDDTLHPGAVRFGWTGPGTYRVVAYKTDNSEPQQVFTRALAGASGVDIIDTGTALGDLTEWNYLVYALADDGSIGPGDVFFAAIDGGYLGGPEPGATPDPAPRLPTPAVTVKTTKTTKVPLKAVKIPLRYNDSSNTPYVGRGPDQQVYGHDPDDAFIDNATYWLSIGNDTNGAGYSYEWLEAKCGDVTLTSVTVHTKGKHYGIYVSVFSNGKWVQHSDTGIIGYNPHLPESHNHANIPYAEYHSEGDTEGPVTIHLRAPIPKVTKIRVTFHNLQWFPESSLHYRAAVRFLGANGQSGGGSKSTTTSTTKVPPVVAGPTTGAASSGETSVTTYTPAHIDPGLGAHPGLYQDYTDIVKLFCAWGGFFWQNGAFTVSSDGVENPVAWGVGEFGLPNVDPVLGDVDGGRVWGDFMQTGTAGIVPIPTNVWTQKSLMDGISYVRDIIGFIFYVDEDGAVVWRRPNLFAIGNWIGNSAPLGTPVRINNVVTIDEETTLVGLRAKLSGRNVRERIFVSTTDGRTGALARGYNPNPTGLRRVGGWTDQYFASEEECQVMADLIALRQLFQYRTDTVTIHGYPAIQVDDQVVIVEQVTSEGYYHYVNAISSNNDLEAGGWTYDLDTYWLGERPFEKWAFNPAELSQETQTYLQALNYGVPITLPAGSV